MNRSLDESGRFNLPLKTLGGKQVWYDIDIYGGWRIQEHVRGRRFRLLDPKDVRRAWGTSSACHQALDQAIARGDAALSNQRCCLLLHGLIRSKDSMARLAATLRAEGYETYSVNYPSTRVALPNLIERVSRLVQRVVSRFDELSFVTHSMGSVIARGILGQPEAPKVHRIVMIAPPNQDVILAQRLKRNPLYRRVFGPAGIQMGTRNDTLLSELPVPSCDFGIIAGGRRDGRGWNPFLPGDDDSVLTVDSTRLEGARDFIVLPHVHTFIMNASDTIACTVNFLRYGAFH